MHRDGGLGKRDEQKKKRLSSPNSKQAIKALDHQGPAPQHEMPSGKLEVLEGSIGWIKSRKTWQLKRPGPGVALPLTCPQSCRITKVLLSATLFLLSSPKKRPKANTRPRDGGILELYMGEVRWELLRLRTRCVLVVLHASKREEEKLQKPLR